MPTSSKSTDVRQSVYWYKDKTPESDPLRGATTADVVVVGGGVAGLTCADVLAQRGMDVVVLERDFCGAGASGRSSGFITPDSEMSLSDLVGRFGGRDGQALWEFAKSGLERIRASIASHAVDCDYRVHDSIWVARTARAYRGLIEREHEIHSSLGYQTTLYDSASIQSVLRSRGYYGGIRNGGTFSMNSYAYCHALRSVLQRRGVRIFERTPALRFTGPAVETPHGSVSAKTVAVFTDSSLPALGLAVPAVHGIRATLSISPPLNDDEVRSIFPAGDLMVWDTDLVYSYFRMTGERRLLVGAGDILSLYRQSASGVETRILGKQRRYLATHFPWTRIAFEQMWSGIIGVSRDFAPVVGRHERFRHVHFAGAAAGLPWAAALGEYIAGRIADGRDEFDRLLSAERPFVIGRTIQRVVGKPAAFALGHGLVKLKP